MTAQEIKNLPDEFNFKSNINPLVDMYHAVKTKDGYVVKSKDGYGPWDFSKSEMHHHLIKGDFVIVKKGNQMTVYALVYTIGLYSGYKELIGVYSSKDKAESMKKLDMKQHGIRNELGYSITPIKIDKTVNEVYQEW